MDEVGSVFANGGSFWLLRLKDSGCRPPGNRQPRQSVYSIQACQPAFRRIPCII